MFAAYNLTEVDRAARTPDLICRLVGVWEASVRATHAFLSEAEIAEIKKYVPSALENVPCLVVAADEKGEIAAFMGIDGRKVEMLFAAPAHRGKGLGKRLMQWGFSNRFVNEVTVNEQNPQAKGFYEHSGFRAVERFSVDEQGKPYPILLMRRDADDA